MMNSHVSFGRRFYYSAQRSGEEMVALTKRKADETGEAAAFYVDASRGPKTRHVIVTGSDRQKAYLAGVALIGYTPPAINAYKTPDLKQSWQNPVCRQALEAVLRNGMFKRLPDLGDDFIAEIGRVCEQPVSNLERYRRLSAFIHRNEVQAAFRSQFNQDESNRIQRRVNQILDLIPADAPPETYADIGCGTGEVTAGLANAWKLPPERATGLEVFTRLKHKDSFTYKKFDGETLPLPSGSQDLASLLMVLHHAKNPDVLIQEVHRILKPGGRLFVRECNADSPGLKLFNDVLDHFYYKVFHDLPGIPTPAHHVSVEFWIGKLQEAGFTLERQVSPEPGHPIQPVHLVFRKRP